VLAYSLYGLQAVRNYFGAKIFVRATVTGACGLRSGE
jgi:hypothetical protein